MNTLTIVLVGIIFLICLTIYLFKTKIASAILSATPRKPKLQILETSEIGWWAYQKHLKIDSLSIKLVKSKLNLFNNKSLIQYTVTGKLSGDDNWKPSIKYIHVSQRFINKNEGKLKPYPNSETPEAIIEFTPVIKTTNDNNYNGEVLDFKFTNEMILESFHWGTNSVRFTCANKWQDLILQQQK